MRFYCRNRRLFAAKSGYDKHDTVINDDFYI